MMKWVVELSEYDIVLEKKGAIKSQVLTDFMVELTQPPSEDILSSPWVLSVNDTANKVGNRVGVVLEGPKKMVVKQSLKFNHNPTHNYALYEALLAGMRLAWEMGV